MKILFSVLAISFFTFSAFANTGLVAKGCYTAQDKKYGPFIVVISIYSDSVTVNYTSSKHGNLGGYRGRIDSPSNIKKTAASVSVENITLSDGGDGYIDKAKINIRKGTVTFDSKNSIEGARPRVECPE